MTSARRIKARHDWRMPPAALRLVAVSQKMDDRRAKSSGLWGKRGGYYILKGRTPIPVSFERHFRWARERNKSGRLTVSIAHERAGQYTVSTIFLGLDHGFMSDVPVLFETMAYRTSDGRFRDEQYRYRTWEEAMTGHKQYVQRLRMQLVTKK